MKSAHTSIKDYVASLPEDRKNAVNQLRKVIAENLPKGFSEEISYGSIGYVVPLEKYPAGYHCKPSTPLPFMNIVSQKNFIALHHMGVYADPKLLEWFTTEWPKHSTYKLDMGKGCIRLKKIDQIPYDLIGKLAKKVTPEMWIEQYEKAFRKK